MSTYPYLSQAAVEITGSSLEHIVGITVVPAIGEQFTLDAEDLKVTFAEDWSPHIQATFTAAVPATTQLDLLDGRLNCRLKIRAGYRYQDGTLDVQDLADLGLRNRGVGRPANQIDLTAESDEARAQDRRRVEDYGPFTTFAGINELVQFFADYAIYPATATVLSDFSSTYGAGAISGITAPIGTAMWDVIADAAARAGVWVHCSGDRKWRIRTRAELAGTPQHVLEVGKNGTIITSDSAIDRTQFANQSIIEYSWTDAGGVAHKVYGRARITTGPYSVDVAGYKTDHVVMERAATQAQADAAAASRVGNLVTRGRSLSLEAHAAYWLRPGMTITVQLPTGPAESHLIKSITFEPGVGKMQIETRQPTDVTITTGE